MVNQEIFSGLASALYRGESLQRAMMTFFNAGYKKEEIEEAARTLRSQGAGQITPQTQASQQQIQQVQSQKPIVKPQQIPPAQFAQQKKVLKKPAIPISKTKPKTTQIVSSYGAPQSNNEELKRKIDKAIYQLKQIRVPSKVKVVESKNHPKPPVVIQKISDYRGEPVKPFNKSLTILLVILLVILLGGLIAVFFFREQLIELFNNLNLS